MHSSVACSTPDSDLSWSTEAGLHMQHSHMFTDKSRQSTAKQYSMYKEQEQNSRQNLEHRTQTSARQRFVCNTRVITVLTIIQTDRQTG
jgi:DNA anti-recombination protein RmuC